MPPRNRQCFVDSWCNIVRTTFRRRYCLAYGCCSGKNVFHPPEIVWKDGDIASIRNETSMIFREVVIGQHDLRKSIFEHEFEHQADKWMVFGLLGQSWPRAGSSGANRG